MKELKEEEMKARDHDVSRVIIGDIGEWRRTRGLYSGKSGVPSL